MNQRSRWLIQVRFIDMAKEKEAVKSFVLRVDPDTMDALERWAADEFRSINGQLQWIISEALRKSGRDKKSNKK
jgi:Uncharacterized protein conserved in bacteria